MKRYELVILGGGAAAFSAAIRASGLGAKTLMINSGELGGTCVNVGCIPSKHILSVADALHKMNNPQFDSLTPQSTGTVDFDKLIRGKDELVLSLREKKYAQVLEQLENVDYLKGKGRFLSQKEVEVNGQSIEGKRFIIATGSSTSVPSIDGIDSVDYLTNIEALSLKRQPESMVVIGGRTLGLEFAQMYQRLGTKVALLQRSPRILPEHEPEISQQLEGYLKEEVMDVHTGLQILSVKRKGNTKILHARDSDGDKEFEGEALLLATGRTPNTIDLNLQATGVELEGEAVKTDLEMRTSVPHIFAAGDVVGKPMLETVAAKEGYIAAENAIKGKSMKMDYSSVPHAVFTDPAVASVGLTDAQAQKEGIKCTCRTVLMEQVPKGQTVNDTRGLFKIVAEAESHRIVGVHILASLAADMIHEGVLAVKFGLTLEDIIDTIHVFPTFSEGIKLTAQSFFEDIEKLSCCSI